MQDGKTFKINKCETSYNFAEQLRRMRQEKGLSLKELAVHAQIDISLLQRMELGYFEDWGSLYSLAKFFDRKIRIEFY